MKLSQPKHIRISQSGNFISYINEYKQYLSIKIDEWKKNASFYKKYYNTNMSSVIKYFFVGDALIVLLNKSGIYSLDLISIEDCKLITKRLLKTSMPNCNLFYCVDRYAITSYHKDLYSDKYISKVYIYTSTNFERIKEIELLGIVEHVFVASDNYYFNIINQFGIEEIIVVDQKNNKYELLKNCKFLNSKILDINNDYIVCTSEFSNQTINFIINNTNLDFSAFSALKHEHIEYAKLHKHYLSVILNNGCNDEVYLINLENNTSTLITNKAVVYKCISYMGNSMNYIESTYNSLSYCSFNLLKKDKTILWEINYSLKSKMKIENVSLNNRVLQIQHFYYLGKKKGTIFYLHGGPSSHFTNQYNKMCDFLSYEGYDIICLNYRGSTGYGKEFEKEIDGNWGIKELEDVIEITEKYTSDNNILLGESYGAFLCLHAMLKKTKLWKKYCMISPFVSPLSLYNNPDFKYKKLIAKQLESEIKFNNLTNWESIDCKILIIHGTRDNIIPISESKKIVKMLKENNKYEFLDYWFVEGNFQHTTNYPSDFLFIKKILQLFLAQ